MLVMIFAATVFLCRQDEKQRCMGVKILSEQEMENLHSYVYRDYSSGLFYNGQKAAIDVASSTIYIAQDIQPESTAENLPGTLTYSGSSHWIGFAPDEGFSDLVAAVADGHAFQLYIANDAGEYMRYQVVFTTLPVLQMDGDIALQEESGKDVYQGTVCLWTPYEKNAARYTVKSGNAQWHVRGRSAATQAKTPWKISLKDKKGSNRDENFLNLGSDDDWILNSLVMDDTKMREQLFMHLWNTLAETEGGNPRMSAGEYVEVVQNQTYMGIYLLQRRVDGKYLQLGTEDVLLKGNSTWVPETIQDGYEIVSSPMEEGQTYGLMEKIWNGEDFSAINRSNFIDTGLFLQYASAIDNKGYKNMFYLFEKEGNNYHLSFIPWDVDMTWGIYYTDGFCYAYDKSMRVQVERMEYEGVLGQYPEVQEQQALRWFSLRESVLSTENVLRTFEMINQNLNDSGARQRDWETWGLCHNGEDSPEQLRRFLEERLSLLDDRYQMNLQ